MRQDKESVSKCCNAIIKNGRCSDCGENHEDDKHLTDCTPDDPCEDCKANK